MNILDRVIKPPIAAPESWADAKRTEHDHTSPLEHDSLHCPHCQYNEKMLQAIAAQVSVTQTLLRKFEEAEGTPHGIPFNFSQMNAVANALYISPQVPYSGVVRSLSVSGPGNVTLTMLTQETAITGGTQICKVICDGTTQQILHRFTVPLEATFQLSTDAAPLGNTILAMSAWIEPVTMSGSEFFRIGG